MTARLHLGCGAHRLPPPWVNVDGCPGAAVDRVMNCHDLWALEAGAYEWVYASHVIEHLFPDKLPAVLARLRDALAPGGRLTLATTDLWKIVTRRFPDDNWEGVLFGHRRSTDPPFAAHLDCFTAEKLTRLLRAAGFATVRPWALADYPELAALNDYASTHADVTLYLEGVR